MYRVVVKNSGKYNNVVFGARYCFTKRSIIHLVSTFLANECECTVEKFARLNRDIFCWSNAEVGSDVWDKIYETLEKITQEED